MIRRLNKLDLDQPFSTGLESFDKDAQGDIIPLSYYLDRDEAEGYETYVLVENDETVGLISYHIRSFTNDHDTMYLSRIGVSKDQQGKGYGKALWRFLYGRCIETGVVIMCCEARGDVAQFFIDLGWEEILTYDDPHWGEGCKTLFFRVPR
jgi:GNAT superfamily N-acetyltransferase